MSTTKISVRVPDRDILPGRKIASKEGEGAKIAGGARGGGGASRASRVVTRKGYAEERTGAGEEERQNEQGGIRERARRGDRRKARTGAIVRRESGTARVCVFRRGFSPVACCGPLSERKGV